VRNELNLPGSAHPDIPEYISSRESKYLKIIQYQEEKHRSLTEIGVKLNKYINNNIIKYSAILIKGLKIKTVDELAELSRDFDFEGMTYNSGSGFRDQLSGSVYSASEEPHDFTIELHNEMSYITTSPSKILFCCISEGTKGGESPICFNRDIARYLNKDIAEKIIKRKIRYIRNIQDEKNTKYITWQKTFETKCKKKAEETMKRQGIKWEWKQNDDLSMYNIVDATRQHPVTKESVWFNQVTANHSTYYQAHPAYQNQHNLQANQYPFHCCYGDGEEFEDETVSHIRAAHWNNAIALKLEQGDVIFMDNYLCNHSRMAFEGSRRVLVQMYR